MAVPFYTLAGCMLKELAGISGLDRGRTVLAFDGS